jgi:hypothetical protein
MRSTIFDNRANENSAAAEMLTTPAMVVASRIWSRVELIFGPDGLQQGCELDHSLNFSAITIKKRGHAALFYRRLAVRPSRAS